LACVALALCGGIALGSATGWAAGLVGVAAVAALSTWAATRQPWSGGAAVLSGGALAGVLALAASGLRPGSDVSRLPEGGQTIIGVVAAAPRCTQGWWSFPLEVEAHEGERGWEPLTGRLYVRLRTREAVRRGQGWVLTGRLRSLWSERNPGGRSQAARLASVGVQQMLTVGSGELARPLGEWRMGGVARHAYAAQSHAVELLTKYMPGPYPELSAAVAAGVIFGVHATPPPAEVTDAFRRAGTIHLLVVSGAMISTVFGLVFLPGMVGARWRRALAARQGSGDGPPTQGRGRVRVRPGITAAVIAALLATYYAVLTEGGQAVARAAIMGFFIGLALVLRRIPAVAREQGLRVDHYTLLAVAALAILVVQPQALFQPGFQLSFAAVWAIIYLTPKAEPFLGWLPRWLGLGVAGTLAAQLATFPILAWHYQQAPVGGFGANLLAVPLAGVVLIAGMATCALGLVLPALAPVAGWVTGISSRWLVWVSATFASLPWASPQVPRPGWAAIIGWYAGMVALGWWLGRVGERRRREETR
jgi:competence protein ComEC